jgi:PrgI family protein
VSPREQSPTARVRIPADVEREDRLLANLTARQLAILGLGGIILWAAYDATRHVIPVAGFAAAAAPFAAVAVLLALGRVGGMPADRLAWAAWRQWRSPGRLVPAPEGVPGVPRFVPGFLPGLVGAAAAPLPAPLPAPLRLPMVAIDDDGLIDLGADGLAVICRASAVSFSLRTPPEQEALVAGFGRYLNSLSDPAQVLVRAEPFDLAPVIAELEHTAPGLPPGSRGSGP